MRIALFVKDYAIGQAFSKNGVPTKSGAEFHAENHAKQLIARGHHVTIFAKKRHFYTKARENIDGIDLVRLHEPFRGGEILLRLLTTHRHIDHIYIIGAPKFAVWAVLFARRKHIPVTLALTGVAEVFDRDSNWRNQLLGSCTNYIATTHEIQCGFEKHGGVSEHQITVLAHGIDCNRYPMVRAEERTALRKEHHISPTAHVLLFCARVVWNKGIDVVMRIWPKIHEDDPEARLFVVGGGRNEIMNQLRDMADATEHSAIITGEVDTPQIYAKMADVYIFPSHHEGLPTSLIEAMSQGLPTVASDIGGCDDLIFDEVTGYRVPVDDDQMFLEKVQFLFENEAVRHQMGQQAHQMARRFCDYSVVIDRLADVIASEKPCGQDFLQTESFVEEIKKRKP